MLTGGIKKQLKDALGIGRDESRLIIVGLGETGYSVARFLNQYGINFAVVDSRDKPPYYQNLLQEMPDIPLFLGDFSDTAFNVSTHLIVSPGVALSEPAVVQAISSGSQVLSDIDLFACIAKAPVVAITGSNGKSTVTTMLDKMAQEAGINVRTGGNIGTPALDLLSDEVELYILEISSFQMERTSRLQAAVATVLNVSADHMDRHKDLVSYAHEKNKIFRGARVQVINADDALVSKMADPENLVFSFGLDKPADFFLALEDGCEWLAFDEQKILPVAELKIQGRHNIANALAALALGKALALPNASMCKALKTFTGLKYRMQKIAEINGVTWINDSKATNVGASIAALTGFKNKVILIAGGDCKNADMSQLATAISARAKAVVLMGRDAGIIAGAIKGSVPAHIVESIGQAVTTAAGLAETGETVLLSPACASLDQFKNYQERGEKFTQAVMGLVA